MMFTPHVTRQGKEIYRLALGDLMDAVESGGRLRAYCPIHGGDHQRSLSIDRASGWGFCHCCHATVQVEMGASTYIFKGESQPLRKRVDAGQLPTITTPDWQRVEVAELQSIQPLMREALTSSWRARCYLAERSIPLRIASASGIGYLSRAVWEQIFPPETRRLLKRWIGRILFPLGSPYGQGFIGRTLLKWEPGMDENAHKALLEQPGAPRRWVKTNPAGWFGFDAPGQLHEWLILVEGGFDRLALLSAGLPAGVVIALVGTAARPSWLLQLAPQVKGVVLALDADRGGKEAMARLADEFQRAGLTVTVCPPPCDRWGKDWNERWRRLGPQSLWPLYEALARQHRGAEKGEGR